ncbi:MAG: acetyl-CoA C-acetyltransferase, partial [Henriciella sp.]
MSDPVVIVGMARTPMAGLLGELSQMTASELGAVAVKATVSEAELKADEADEIIMGNCLPAGQGQAPARQAGFKAGLDKGLEATTINK